MEVSMVTASVQAHAVVTGEGDAAFLGEITNLRACAKDQYDLNIQGLQDGDVLQKGAEAGLLH
jgi:hypothetical protein